MKVAGIYRISVQRPDGSSALYFGQSSNCKKRFSDHIKTLRGNRHDNSRLQRSFNKYGESAFSFDVVVICRVCDLTMYEQAFVDAYASDDMLNIMRECVTSSRGVKRSAEFIAKMSAARKGRVMGPCSEATKAKISAGNKGRVRSPELRAAIGAAQKGRKVSEETRAKMSAAHKGQKMSETARQKMGTSAKARMANPLTRAKLSSAMMGNRNMVGKTIPVETRIKMAQSAKRREAEKRHKHLTHQLQLPLMK
jgi:group I intron endonuclease